MLYPLIDYCTMRQYLAGLQKTAERAARLAELRRAARLRNGKGWATILDRLEGRGYRAAIVPATRADDLRRTYARQRHRGVFGAGVWEWLERYVSFDPPAELQDPRSLVVLAVRRPQTAATFVVGGERRRYIVPPTYAGAEESEAQARAALMDLLGPRGHRVALARLPLKLLAACAGVTLYGRNNIAYVPGWGSFLRLIAFFSDMPVGRARVAGASGPAGWGEPRLLPACEKCSACRRACPTGAIADGRFLLRAERCLPFYNEGVEPLPDWIDPGWHNCLVGCGLCQWACPENRAVRDWVGASADFDVEETQRIVGGTAFADLTAETQQKLRHAGLAEYMDILPRNLQVLLEQRALG
jgi:epoxyqueuosine reductase